MRNVSASSIGKWLTTRGSVDDSTIRQDVGQRATLSKLAAALGIVSPRHLHKVPCMPSAYLGKVFTGCILRHWVEVVRELTSGACLTCAVRIELAGNMGRVWAVSDYAHVFHVYAALTLSLGRTSWSAEVAHA